jgi:hypothetical protein
MRWLIICTLKYYSGDHLKEDEEESLKMHRLHFCRNTLKEIGKLDVLDVDGWAILKWILQKQGVIMWTGFDWLRSWTRGGLL